MIKILNTSQLLVPNSSRNFDQRFFFFHFKLIRRILYEKQRKRAYLLEDTETRCSIPIEHVGQQYNTKVHLGHYYQDYDTCWSLFHQPQHL